jgi:hypothetical protein
MPKTYKNLSYRPFLRKSKKSSHIGKKGNILTKTVKNSKNHEKTQNIRKKLKIFKKSQKIAKTYKKSQKISKIDETS